MENSNVSRLEEGMALEDKELVVYTCITGNYEECLTYSYLEEGVSYVCFSDNESNVPVGWTYMPIKGLDHLDNKDKNRYIKMHPSKFLPNHKLSIYIDFNIDVIGRISNLISSINSSDNYIFMYQHPFRDCIYAEARSVIKQGLTSFFATKKQIKSYQQINLPKAYGLFEANIIIRKDTLGTSKLMESWWEEYKIGSRRDQIALMAASFKTGIQIKSLGECYLREGSGGFFFLDTSKRKRRRSFTHYFVLILNNFLLKIVDI